jgi:hypothetical protein
MPMRPIIAAAALVLPITLAACGQRTVEATNEKPSVVASKVAAAGEAGAVRFSPGRWETTMQFIKMDVPGMPPEAKTMMEKMVGKGRTFSSCLTKEEAEKPGGKFFGQTDKNCTYDHFSMGGGKMDAKITCKSEMGPQVMAMSGSYTPESYETTMDVNSKGPTGQPMTMTMKMSSHHAGACNGKEDSGA